MHISKQVVFIAYPTIKDGVLDLKVFSDRGDALRFTKGAYDKVISRVVIPATLIGRYRKPPKPKKKKAARARR